MKFIGLERVAGNVRRVVFGSSHAHYGYVAGADEFNLADISCDLYYCHAMLEYWLPRLPKLRTVVVFCDLFSAGSCIERSSEAFRRVPWLYFYGMKPQEDSPRLDTDVGISYQSCDEAFDRFVTRGMPEIPGSYRGNALRRPSMSIPDPQRRVASHLRFSRGDKLRWLKATIEACRSRGLRVLIVYPPLRSDFKALMDGAIREAYRPVEALLGVKSWEIVRLDLSDDDRFKDDDFADMDHLNATGAAKLTHLVRECDIMSAKTAESVARIGDGQLKAARFHGRKFA